jgi:hypothetical protein
LMIQISLADISNIFFLESSSSLRRITEEKVIQPSKQQSTG